MTRRSQLEDFDICFLIEDDEESGWKRGDTCSVLDWLSSGCWIVEMSEESMLRRVEENGLTIDHPSARLIDETPVLAETILRRITWI